ncbi:MAG: hypothetical protein WBE05_20195, partial [Pseudolabrys sp.]
QGKRAEQGASCTAAPANTSKTYTMPRLTRAILGIPGVSRRKMLTALPSLADVSFMRSKNCK